MKKKGGYGVVYQDVTRNKNITAAAKGLYAYLSAYCGASDECYPSVETIVREMSMAKDTFYRHINALVAAGVVEKRQITNGNGQFGRTVYKLTHEVVITDYPITKNEDADNEDTDNLETKNNNTKSNNMNNNNISCAPESHDVTLDKEEELKKNFEIIYEFYPKKRGRTAAYAKYKTWVGKGKYINGKRYRLTNRQIWFAIQRYINQQKAAGQNDLTYWKNFDTFMGLQLLDYINFNE